MFKILEHLLYEFSMDKLEDLKGSPDLLNNVKIGQGQLQLIMIETHFVLTYMRVE